MLRPVSEIGEVLWVNPGVYINVTMKLHPLYTSVKATLCRLESSVLFFSRRIMSGSNMSEGRGKEIQNAVYMNVAFPHCPSQVL